MRINLWEAEEERARGIPGQEGGEPFRPHLIPFLLEGGQARAAVIVCPGGGYGKRADHEGEPVARWLNRLGLHAFVLHYRVAPYRHPEPLEDAKRAIRHVRLHAGEWGIDPGRVGVLGFSAGGHLTSTLGTHWDAGRADAPHAADRLSCRPDVMILCYPVISFKEYRHQGSVSNLLGPEPEDARIELLSNEGRVSTDTPPTFLWHTADDSGVPVENSLLFASALSRCKVPMELHCYQSGRHGLGLALEHPEAFQWTGSCELWLRKQGYIE